MQALERLKSSNTHETLSGYTAARMSSFNLKCAKHMLIKGAIHCHDYDENVFHVFKFEQNHQGTPQS